MSSSEAELREALAAARAMGVEPELLEEAEAMLCTKAAESELLSAMELVRSFELGGEVDEETWSWKVLHASSGGNMTVFLHFGFLAFLWAMCLVNCRRIMQAFASIKLCLLNFLTRYGDTDITVIRTSGGPEETEVVFAAAVREAEAAGVSGPLVTEADAWLGRIAALREARGKWLATLIFGPKEVATHH